MVQTALVPAPIPSNTDNSAVPTLVPCTNRRAYVLPRQIAMYIARQLTGASLVEIGHQFGGRHHNAVPPSINRNDAAL